MLPWVLHNRSGLQISSTSSQHKSCSVNSIPDVGIMYAYVGKPICYARPSSVKMMLLKIPSHACNVLRVQRLNTAWESPLRWTEMPYVGCLLQLLPPWPKPGKKWKKMMQRKVTDGRRRSSTAIVHHSQRKNKQIKIKCLKTTLYQHHLLFYDFPFYTYEWGWYYIKKKKNQRF